MSLLLDQALAGWMDGESRLLAENRHISSSRLPGCHQACKGRHRPILLKNSSFRKGDQNLLRGRPRQFDFGQIYAFKFAKSSCRGRFWRVNGAQFFWTEFFNRIGHERTVNI